MADGASVEAIYKKVIIVGGSVAGLTLALALEHTDIDFVVIERGDYAPPLGASFVLMGCGMRILDQLGVVDAIKEEGETFTWLYNYHEDGRLIVKVDAGKMMNETCGYPFTILERREVLQCLYNAVKDKSRLLSRNGAVSYTESADGVTVTCEDGTVYKGDILVGADGIHSKVRDFMYDHLLADSGVDSAQKSKIVKTRKDLSAEFSCVFGNTEKIPGLSWPIGTAWNYQGIDRNVGGFVAKDERIFFFLFEKIPRAVTPNIPRYTKEDAQAAMATVAHVKMDNSVTIGDMFAKCTQYGKVALEEHMFEVCHSKRTVIIGDSLHKMTPNDGWGGTMAIESAAYLANFLNKHLSRGADTTPIATTQDLLEQFALTRKDRVPPIIAKSAKSTRLQAGVSVMNRFVRGSIVPLLSLSTMLKEPIGYHAGGKCIDYLPKPKHNGTVPYCDEQQPAKKGWFS